MTKVLIVDDELVIREMIKEMLEALGYTPLTAENGEEALEIVEKENPQIILMDLKMPVMDGISIIEKIRKDKYDPVIIVLTAYPDMENMRRSAEAGADDFLIKPIDMVQLSTRLELAKKAKLFYSFQKSFFYEMKRAKELDKEIIEKLIKENTELSYELLKRLQFLAEYRDYSNHEHINKVGEIAYELARALNLPLDYCYSLRIAASLHDIGKILIPDKILLKEEPLTSEEFEEMKKHTEIGKVILSDSKSNIIKLTEIIALTHHERWDGKGYPQGLSGEKIPLEGRIVCIADAIDAMFSKRPYKDPFPENKVKEELIKEKGKQFDPLLVDKVLELWDKILKIEGLI